MIEPRAARSIDPRYPRPQLVRDGWTDLCGSWRLAFDDEGAGLARQSQGGAGEFPLVIEVPTC